MDKRAIIQAFIEHLTHERNALMQSAKAAHDAATHDESAAEDRHDTFAIELSYLAHGQAERVVSLSKSIQEFESLLTQVPSKSKMAMRGSLVTLECEGKKSFSLLAHHGGGASVKVGDVTVAVVTPESPLGDLLFGASADEELTVDTKNGAKEYLVLEVDS